MTPDTLMNLAFVCVGTFCAAFAALYFLALLSEMRTKKNAAALHEGGEAVVFLFDDENLVNATPSAKSILASTINLGSDWSKLLNALKHRFPNLQEDMASLARQGRLELVAQDRASVLQAEWREGLARISLLDMDTAHKNVALDHHSLAAMEQELEMLRETSENVPFLVWRTLPDGTIYWANGPYIALADELDDSTDTPSWPPKKLFETDLLFSTAVGNFKRLNISGDNEKARYYDVFPMPIGAEVLYTAIPAERIVRAEGALREFMQTLTKTFAHLTTGLAVFDRNRKLVLFNPALADLTCLPVDFLAIRPALTDFLDRLHNQNMMPEPKDYKSWRQEMSELEAAAEKGSYEEIWSLTSGVTYKVSGRPHPDGAIAFLFEDISAEMSLTRQFRSEIETSKAVLDTLSEAIAVFANDGSLLTVNTAYLELWGASAKGSIQVGGVQDAAQIWREKCAPTAMWRAAQEFIRSPEGNRQQWSESARLWDGRRLLCKFAPLPGGQTLATFVPKERLSLEHLPSGVEADIRAVEL